MSSIEVRGNIKDQVAVTTIEQEFYNPNPTRIEGTFICPLPKGTHVNKFTMEIDGKQCEAELIAAGKARKIYEDIVSKMKDPALMEYAGRDMLKVRIFPFEPKSRKRITLKYTELLKNDSGLVTYSLPLSVEKFSAKPVSNTVVTVNLESTRPLKSIYSPTHEVEVKRSGKNKAKATLESTEGSAPGDFTLYFSAEKDEIGFNLLTCREGEKDGYFLLLASPGTDGENKVVAKDVAFVLDTSGSMAGKKIEQARKALEFCIENLNEKDRFEIVRFATETEGLFDKLAPASKANREKALDFTRDLRASGGTAIDDALKEALALREENEPGQDRPYMVIFLTDGRPTVGETGEDEIVSGVKKRNKERSRVFCFGIGTDVNTHLLDKITEQTRAFSTYVLPEEDLEVKVSNFYSKVSEPVLVNPRLSVSGGPKLSKMYPSELPDLFRGEQLVIVGRYSGSGDASFELEGTVNGAKRKFTYEGSFSGENREHEFLPRLWATRRVGYLLDEIRLNGENSELKEEVTELARRYGIVTPYTSYLIVEDEDRRQIPARERLMGRMHEDSEARNAGRELWGSLQAKDGLEAASAARSSQAYKSAAAPSAAAAGGAFESMRALGVPNTTITTSSAVQDKGKLRLAQYSQQAQFVGGKTFFQNDRQWVDSAIQQSSKTRVVTLKVGTEEYFEFGRKHPEALPWLALGNNVRFLLDGVIYEIQES